MPTLEAPMWAVRLTPVLLVSLLLGACGGGEDPAGGDAEQPPGASAAGEDDAGDGEDGGGSVDCMSGMACSEGLIAELATFPVPDFVDEFSEGSPDLGGESSQSLFFTVAPGEVAAFYEKALPEAGFDVSPDQNPDHSEDFQYDVIAPDGREGSIWIRGASSHPSQAQVSLEASG